MKLLTYWDKSDDEVRDLIRQEYADALQYLDAHQASIDPATRQVYIDVVSEVLEIELENFRAPRSSENEFIAVIRDCEKARKKEAVGR
jgi:hypothetical protein